MKRPNLGWDLSGMGLEGSVQSVERMSCDGQKVVLTQCDFCPITFYAVDRGKVTFVWYIFFKERICFFMETDYYDTGRCIMLYYVYYVLVVFLPTSSHTLTL